MSGSVVCVGEALVDLICPTRLDCDRRADHFDAHCGGALANVAVSIVRAGGRAQIACGVGDDEFGELLRERLGAEGVGLGLMATVAGMQTPFAFVRFDSSGEPSYDIHGVGIDAGFEPMIGSEPGVVAAAAAIAIGTNTLVGEPARSLTLRIRELALEAGVPVLFDPNLRPGRWEDPAEARRRSIEMIAGTRLTKADLAEVRLLADRPGISAEQAAEFLVESGAELGVVTDGARPVVARGLAAVERLPPAVDDPSPVGAGDALMGSLIGHLSQAGWDGDAVGDALSAAVEAAAWACGSPEALG